jgi:hypothetical protein
MTQEHHLWVWCSLFVIIKNLWNQKKVMEVNGRCHIVKALLITNP